MVIKDENYAFHQAFVSVIERLREQKFMEDGEMTHSEFAKRAFLGVSDPVRKWRFTRQKGQAVTVGEAHMMCKVLGQDTGYVMHLAAAEMKNVDKSMRPKEKTVSIADKAKEDIAKKAG